MALPEECASGYCSQSYLDYQPSLPANAVFCGLFSTLILVAIFLGARYHGLVFSLLITTGLALETLGYVGRVLLSAFAYNQKTFALFFLGTILGPNLISCALFLCVPNLVHTYGPNFRTWTPPWYHSVFFGLAGISFSLELAGGLLATAVGADVSQVRLGMQLAAVGLAVLIVALAIFTAHATLLALALRTRRHGLGFEYAYLYNSNKYKTLLFALSASTFLLFLRSTFRIIIMIEGFSGQEAQNEILLLVLDGAAVFLAAFLLLVIFPPRILSQSWFNFSVPKDSSITSGYPTQYAQSQDLRRFDLTNNDVSQHASALYQGMRLPPPPPGPPPQRPMRPPQRSPGAYSDYSIESSQRMSVGGVANHSRKQPSVISSAEPSPANPRLSRGPTPAQQPKKNLVESESLW